jgi:predicted GNAT family acetyltransferase
MDEQRLIQILDEGDRDALEAFLRPQRASSLFLLSNLRAAGLVDQGLRYQGTYAAVVAGTGEILGVAAHYWNGNVIFQAPTQSVPGLLQAAFVASPRKLKGLIGPAEQVETARSELALTGEQIQLDSTEKLYRLSLENLEVPAALSAGEVRGRRMTAADLDLVTEWRAAFAVETLGEADDEELRRRTRITANSTLQERRTWLLEDEDGRPVSHTAFNAATADAVQVGGVWTPPALRSRGYGRAVVAASLLDARAEGVEEAILFTDEDNLPAQRAYEALGFRQVGDYRLLFLKAPLGLEAIL